MAERIFRPARRAGTTVPVVRAMKYKTGEVIIEGSLTVTDANGEQTLCGADPATVRGVALQAAGRELGKAFDFDSQVVARTGYVQQLSIAIAEQDIEFSGQMYNAGNIVAPLQTHVGEQYGVVKLASGVWVIDETDVVNVVVEITDIVEAQGGDPGFHIFKFLDSVLEA